ncbi:unnamed protein product [Caenorhabditis angaria]|uniref:G-protein coupled receptors family 1 profile domain-containing protein n=1 Tax=Caenorhabditis angaria TaxID=860376 RepID=A0A9P1IXL3_9PELO|nr:unnamed protein product [Caenorhabditis angaria]
MNSTCLIMNQLSSSISLKFALFLNLSLCFIAIPTLFWALSKLSTLQLHHNTKIIMSAHLFGFLLHCSGRVVLHSLDLFNYIFRDPCNMVPSIYRCFVFRLFYNIGLWITNCTVFPLMIERSIATYRNGSYENSSKLIGIGCIVLHFILTAIPLLIVYSNLRFEGVFMPYCQVIKPAFPTVAQLNGVVSTIVQLTCRIIFSILFRLNQKWRQKSLEANLSTRFQLEQNINTMEILKVFANLTTVVQTFQTGSFLLLLHTSNYFNLTNEIYISLMEINAIFPLYGIVTVAILTMKIKKIRLRVRSILKNHVKTDPNIYLINFDQQIGSTAKASNPLTGQISGLIAISAQIFSRIFFTYLLRINKTARSRDQKSSLSHRFQLEQNLSSINFLKIFSTLSSCYLIFQNSCFITLLHFASSMPSEYYYATTELNATYPLYSIVTICLMSIYIRKNRTKINNELLAHVRTGSEHYFSHLKRILDK